MAKQKSWSSWKHRRFLYNWTIGSILRTIAREPEMEIVAFGYADYERIAGQKVMEEIILSYGTDFNAVYTHKMIWQ